MNRKGRASGGYVFILIILLFYALLILISVCISYGVKDKACKQIGFEKKIYNNDFYYCEDSNGNLHYVKMDCNFFGSKCTAKKITVGEVEVKK